MEHFDADTIMVTIIAMVNILWIYLHCLLGKLVTNRFDQLPCELFKSQWCELPIGLQKYFILLLANTQKPLFFHGFKVYVLNLETFTSVSRIDIGIFLEEEGVEQFNCAEPNFLCNSFSDTESSLLLLYDVQKHWLQLNELIHGRRCWKRLIFLRTQQNYTISDVTLDIFILGAISNANFVHAQNCWTVTFTSLCWFYEVYSKFSVRVGQILLETS